MFLRHTRPHALEMSPALSIYREGRPCLFSIYYMAHEARVDFCYRLSVAVEENSAKFAHSSVQILVTSALLTACIINL